MADAMPAYQLRRGTEFSTLVRGEIPALSRCPRGLSVSGRVGSGQLVSESLAGRRGYSVVGDARSENEHRGDEAAADMDKPSAIRPDLLEGCQSRAAG